MIWDLRIISAGVDIFITTRFTSALFGVATIEVSFRTQHETAEP